jgi:MFS family permease
MNTYQFINVTNSTNEAPIAYIQDRFTFLGQNVVVVILVPLWNNIIFPLMGHYLPNTRKRVGIGLALGCLACIVSVIIPAVLKIHYSWYWLCIPTVLIGIAETSVYIPILVFIYAQSPDNMKGLLIGCHYLIIGIWSAIAAVVDYFLKQNTSHQNDVIVGYYAVLTAISFINLVIFSFISYFYRNRKRNNPITDLLRISMYY